MLTHSSTREPLAPSQHDSALSPSSSDDRSCANHLRVQPPLPFPVMSRSSTRSSSASYSSTMPLNHSSPRNMPRSSFVQKLFPGWKRNGEVSDREAQRPGHFMHDEGSGTSSLPLRMLHGWRLIIFDSWLNVLILLVPAAGILKLCTQSETLIFVACLLAMIPLVKLHDLATGVLSRRIGGNRTGLLNSSLSNIVELVVAIIALRKCEIRVVQSSLIGAMLSKLLLILGMCFFAGGLKFSEQGFDSTATQIHSSLLSISVGAVLLPAAFHFALTRHDGDDTGTSLQEQKEDILRMSHGVAIVLLFIYASYLLFQLWSHTHLYKDNAEPSTRLPVAASIRTATARVREKSSTIYERINNVRSIEHLRTGSLQTLRALGHKSSVADSRAPSPDREKPISPLEELPETSIDLSDSRISQSYTPSQIRTGAYYMQPSRSLTGDTLGNNGAGGNSKETLLVSPFMSTSQVTLSNPIAIPDDTTMTTTVRLVSDQERFVIRREDSSDSEVSSDLGSTSSGSGSRRVSDERDPFDEDEDRRWDASVSRQPRGRSRTPISDVLSAYYAESLKGEGEGEVTPRRGVDRANPGENMLQNAPPSGTHGEELSWTLTMLLLMVVTVLVAIDAEWLVDGMDHLSPWISKEWIGLILLPTVSALAECVTAVNVSVQDQLTLSISVAVGSTIQTALFVIPSMVILGWALDKPLALLFDPFESVVLYISVHTMGYVVADGKSNWLEGVILVCLYVIIAVTFWFYPGSNFSTNLAVCTTSAPINIKL